MKVWPTELDQKPRAKRTWVRPASGEGTPSVSVSESPEQIQARLEDNFPIVRAVGFGKLVVRKVLGRTHEI